jgi:hypothetical protein
MRTHGKRSCYKAGCRAAECLEADRLYRRDLRRRKRRDDPIYEKCPRCGDDFVEGSGLSNHLNRCKETA